MAVEADSEVLGVEPEPLLVRADDLLEERGRPFENGGQLDVVEDLLLVQDGELLAQRDGVLPLLVLLEVLDDLEVELFFALPLFLTRIPKVQK